MESQEMIAPVEGAFFSKKIKKFFKKGLTDTKTYHIIKLEIDTKTYQTKGEIKMKKVELRVVMKRAWEIARKGVKKFGGKVREYFAVALKIAWKELRKTVANEGGYVRLVGSEKQIKWAEDVRKNAIEKLQAIASELEIKLADVFERKQRKAEAFNRYKEEIEQLKNEEKASFWIDAFGYEKLHVEVAFAFRRHLEKKGEKIILAKIREDIQVAESLDFKIK